MSLEKRWGPVELENLKGTPWQLMEPRAVVARQPMLAGGEAIPLPNIPEIRGDSLKRKLCVLRGDVERLGAADGCVARTYLIFGNRASVTHSATCTRRMQDLLDKEEVGRVRLELRRLPQPDEVVVEQPAAGRRPSDESEERNRKRLRSIAAGEAAVPSVEVSSESMQAESKKRAADTAIEDIDPRMDGKEATADDDVTIAAGQVSAGHGDDPMGEGTANEGQVAAVDALQPSGPAPLEDLLGRRHALVFVLGRCERRMVENSQSQ